MDSQYKSHHPIHLNRFSFHKGYWGAQPRLGLRLPSILWKQRQSTKSWLIHWQLHPTNWFDYWTESGSNSEEERTYIENARVKCHRSSFSSRWWHSHFQWSVGPCWLNMDESMPLEKIPKYFFTNNSNFWLTRLLYFIRFRIVEWFWKNNPQNWPKPSDYFYKVKATVSQLLLERNFKKSSMELSFFLKKTYTHKDFFLFLPFHFYVWFDYFHYHS